MSEVERPGFISRLKLARQRRKTRDMLERLSDRELRDIGFCRGDINYIVTNGIKSLERSLV